MTVAFYTLGCKVNQVDSSAILARMTAAGYICVPADTAPDILVLNSCAVTAESERKTRQKLRHFRKIYQTCILVLTGCAAQANADAGAEYPDADIILGHRDAADLARYIDEFLLSRQQIVKISAHQRDEVFDNLPSESVGRTRANVKIQDGCDRFCSYCIIPHARGRVRSKPLSVLGDELQSLAQSGFCELVLVGINLTSYGSDLGCDLGDAVLLADEAAAGSPTLRRVRLGSLEPDHITDTLLDKLSRAKSLCPQFHLSLQSGSDRTLKCMQRHYSTSEYFSIVNRLRDRFLGAAITTDIMVGFPGETDAEFKDTLSFARAVGFAKIHVFPYSPRRGTPAAAMPEQISKAEKQARAQQTLSLAEELNREFLLAQVGQPHAVLLEEPFPGGGMQGYTARYAPVAVPEAGPALRNQLTNVNVTHVIGDVCIGTLLH